MQIPDIPKYEIYYSGVYLSPFKELYSISQLHWLMKN
jgi:hypothetical protein